MRQSVRCYKTCDLINIEDIFLMNIKLLFCLKYKKTGFRFTSSKVKINQIKIKIIFIFFLYAAFYSCRKESHYVKQR